MNFSTGPKEPAWKKYQRAHVDLCRAKSRRHHHAHKEKINRQQRDRMRALYERDSERIKAKNREWYRNNREKRYESLAKRKALKKQADVNLAGIMAFRASVLSRKRFCCSYYNRVQPISEVHFDHIIPLSKGGSHSVENLCISCQTCNLKKGARIGRFFNAVNQGCFVL